MIVGENRQRVVNGNGGKADIGKRKRAPFMPPFALEQSCLFGHFRCEGIELQAGQKRFGGRFFMVTQAGINLSNVNWATGQEMALVNECPEVFAPAPFSIEAVEND